MIIDAKTRAEQERLKRAALERARREEEFEERRYKKYEKAVFVKAGKEVEVNGWTFGFGKDSGEGMVHAVFQVSDEAWEIRIIEESEVPTTEPAIQGAEANDQRVCA